MFKVIDNEVIEKIATTSLDKFDTLRAAELIEKKFGDKKQTNWNNTFVPNASIYSTMSK